MKTELSVAYLRWTVARFSDRANRNHVRGEQRAGGHPEGQDGRSRQGTVSNSDETAEP
jgi:hypothetical protein